MPKQSIRRSIQLALSTIALGSMLPSPVTASPITSITDIQKAQTTIDRQGTYFGPTVTIEGTITLVAPGRLNGFFIQDGSSSTRVSSGLFVEGIPLTQSIKQGDKVEVTGQIKLAQGETRLVMHKVNITGRGKIAPLPIQGPINLQQLEPYSGMLVTFQDNNKLTINSDYRFNYGLKRSRMELTLGSPLVKPSQLYAARSVEAEALTTANKKNRIELVTDELRQTKGKISYFPNLDPQHNYFRVGDQIRNLTAIVTKEQGRFVLIPTHNLSQQDLIPTEPRQPQPPVKAEGNLRVASFNLENLFNQVTLLSANNPLGHNRGADHLQDYQRQLEKLASAIEAMNADIVGLVEVENDGFASNSTIVDLLKVLNAKESESSRQYQFIQPAQGGVIGGDAITSGVLYRPARVKPIDELKIIDLPVQRYEVLAHYDRPNIDYRALRGQASARPTVKQGKRAVTARQRPSILQSFQHIESGESLTIVVNHLKSKGSSCLEDYQPYQNEQGEVAMTTRGRIRGQGHAMDDHQGSCNNFRVTAAKTLGDYLNTHQKELSDNILLLGDFNSYAMEDPIRLLTEISDKHLPVTTAQKSYLKSEPLPVEHIDQGYGFTNLVTMKHGSNSFSYSFGGELGTLDYALASPALLPKVVDAVDWQINARESELFGYSTKYSGRAKKDSSSPYSSSDHDPVVVELHFGPTS